MEEEAEKLKEMQSEVDKQMNLSSPGVSKSYLRCFILPNLSCNALITSNAIETLKLDAWKHPTLLQAYKKSQFSYILFDKM